MKYTISWKDTDNKDCQLTMDNMGTDSAVMNLTPAEHPFVTSEDNTTDPYVPVRTGSAKISFLKNSNQYPKPANNKQWRVLLKVDGTVAWAGWLKGESLSQPFQSERVRHEMTINAIADINTLDTERISLAGGLDFVSLKNMLLDALLPLEQAAESYSVVFPNELKRTAVSDNICNILDKLQVPRFNFFTRKKNSAEGETILYEGDTRMEVLEKLCRFFGWSARQIGTTIYFHSIGCNSYLSPIQIRAFRESNPTTSATRNAAPFLTSYGKNHMQTIEPGCKSVSVVSKFHKVEADIPEVKPSNMRYYASQAMTCQRISGETRKNYPWVFRYMENNIEGVTLNRADGDVLFTLDGNQWQPNEDDAFKTQGMMTVNSGFPTIVGAHAIQSDHWGGPSYDKGTCEKLEDKRNFSFSDFIYCRGNFNDRPLIRIESKGFARYENGGIEIGFDFHCPDVNNSPDERIWPYGTVLSGNSAGFTKTGWQFVCKLQIGGQYWNGTSWQSSSTTFNIASWEFPPHAFGNEKSQKLLTMDFISTRYAVPIINQMFGRVLFDLIRFDFPGDESHRFFMKNLTFAYKEADGIHIETDQKDKTYKKSFSSWINEKDSVELDICSATFNSSNYGSLMWEGTKIGLGGVYSIKHTKNMLCEDILLDKLAAQFGRSASVVNAKAKTTDTHIPTSYHTIDGKNYDIIAEIKADWKTNEAEYLLRDF